MAKNKKSVEFQKIPLEALIEILQEIYSQGADYIDISGMPNEEQDVLSIYVRDEYFSDENDELSFDEEVPKELLDEFKVINIHPSLLPKFGGKGMWGLNVHKSVIESGEVESGITVHWVNSEYDKGRIIAQFSCDVYSSDTPEILQSKIKELEMEYFPKVIGELLTPD